MQSNRRFNPHPPSLAGEAWKVARASSNPFCFNPHPPSLAGEAPPRAATQMTLGCFNPHPPSLAGEAGHVWPARRTADVSIHTRHHWRVKPLIRIWMGLRAMFQSTPAITGG